MQMNLVNIIAYVKIRHIYMSMSYEMPLYSYLEKANLESHKRDYILLGTTEPWVE